MGRRYGKTGMATKGERVFINLSNHPSANWDSMQSGDALKYGRIVDMPFPLITVDITEEKMEALVEQYYDRIMQYKNPVVMLQGEFVFVYRMVARLKDASVRVFCACTERRSVEEKLADGSVRKISYFEYSGLREY